MINNWIMLTLSSEFFAPSFIQTAERRQDNERGHRRQWCFEICLLSLPEASGPFAANGTMARRVRWLHAGWALLLCVCSCKCCYFVMYCLWGNLFPTIVRHFLSFLSNKKYRQIAKRPHQKRCSKTPFSTMFTLWISIARTWRWPILSHSPRPSTVPLDRPWIRWTNAPSGSPTVQLYFSGTQCDANAFCTLQIIFCIFLNF